MTIILNIASAMFIGALVLLKHSNNRVQIIDNAVGLFTGHKID